MDEFDVRELRYFVAVAEELNFSRAAERLGIAQPPLSRAIRRMEHRLGAELLHRDTHRVTLTPVGATLLGEAHGVLDAVVAATRRTQRAAPKLLATAKPGVPTAMLRRIVDAYTALPDAVQVEIMVSGYSVQADLVRDGRVDVALLTSPYEQPGLDTELLTTQPRVAALSAGHPLTRHAALRCADLVGEPFAQWPNLGPAERAYWSGRDSRLSLADRELPEPVAGPAVSGIEQLLDVVSLGQAVALIPQDIAEQHPRPDLAYRRVVDASPYRTAVAWPAGSRDKPITQFVRTAIALTSSTWNEVDAHQRSRTS